MLRTYHKTGTEAEVLLKENNYNELDQLTEKNLHSTNFAQVEIPNFLQSVDYVYNIRGWLEKINDLYISTTVDGAEVDLIENGTIILRFDASKLATGEKSDLKSFSTMEVQKSDGTETIENKEKELILDGTTTNYPDSVIINLTDKQISKTTLEDALSTLKDRTYIELSAKGITDGAFIDKVINEVHSLYRNEWLRVIANDDNDDLFKMRLDYTQGNTNVNANPQFNGNISNIAWQVAGQEIKVYGFEYDQLNRLKNADYANYAMGATGAIYSDYNKYGVSGINYDKNGNILSLGRNGMTGVNNDLPTFGTVDDLSYFYTGNQLNIVNDQGTLDYGFKDIPSGSKEYYYDANGNMTEDKNKGIIIEYNHINLPTKVTFVNQYKSIEWTYDAAGIKLEKKTIFGNNINTKDYIGGIEYANDKIEAVYQEEGRIVAKDSDVGLSDGTTTVGVISWQYEYSLSDHLGNSRVMFSDLNEDGLVDETEILQSQAYYPFGLVHEGTGSQQIGAQNKYQYNGTEWLDDFDLNLNEHGSRLFDPTLGRFTALDPLAEAFPGQSPYHFAYNNPIRYKDPTGLAPKDYTYDWDTGAYLNNKGKEVSWGKVKKSIDKSGQAQTIPFGEKEITSGEVITIKHKSNGVGTNTSTVQIDYEKMEEFANQVNAIHMLREDGVAMSMIIEVPYINSMEFSFRSSVEAKIGKIMEEFSMNGLPDELTEALSNYYKGIVNGGNWDKLPNLQLRNLNQAYNDGINDLLFNAGIRIDAPLESVRIIGRSSKCDGLPSQRRCHPTNNCEPLKKTIIKFRINARVDKV